MVRAASKAVGLEPLFSVIIPVHNTEQYVGDAVRSVLRQTEASLELIIIDDESRDGSLKVCQDLAAQDNRIKILTQPNAGQGAARNRGLDIASGKFILFVDSDDTIEPNLLEIAADRISDADFLNFGFEYVDDRGVIRRPMIPYSVSVLEGPAIFYSALVDTHVLTTPCNKTYRRDVIEANAVRFPTLRAWEDTYFSREMARVSQKAVFDQFIGYHALVRPGSTSRGISSQKIDDAIALFELEKRAFATELSDPPALERFEAHRIKFMMQLLVLSVGGTSSPEEYRRCYAIAAKNGFTSGKLAPGVLAHLPLKVRVVARLARHPLLLRLAVRLAAMLGLRPN